MFEKVVALLDGSTLAQKILPHTRTVADVFQSEITLLHVLERKEKSDTGRLDPVHWHLRRIEAQSFMDSIAMEKKLAHMHPEILLLEGDASTKIGEYVQESRPDLVMLTSHGEKGHTPWSLSSVAYKTIHRAPCSFLLVHARRNASGEGDVAAYRRIALLLDGSKRAECALPFASRLAAAQKAQLILVHAQIPHTIIHDHALTQQESATLDRLNARNKSETKRYLQQIGATVETGVEVALLTGPSCVDSILNYVNNQDNQIDLVVMSAHGQTSQTARPFGTVVTSIITYTHPPLLIIQDLPPEQLLSSEEDAQAVNDDAFHTNRKITHAQPAHWSPE